VVWADLKLSHQFGDVLVLLSKLFLDLDGFLTLSLVLLGEFFLELAISSTWSETVSLLALFSLSLV
jgi:hypothetical protein